MSPSRQSSPATERAHELWDELVDFDASCIDDALVHAMTTLADMVRAQNVFWMGTVRLSHGRSHDPLKGWRPGAIRYLHPSAINARFYEQAKRRVRDGETDESMRGNVRHAGEFRAALLRDLVSRAWFKSPFYDLAYRARGVSDAMFVVSPVNRDTESYFGFHRADGQPRFTRRERDQAAHALRGLKWFHRQLLLSHGLLVAGAPLAPTERRVLRGLLTHLSEKEIAHRVGCTPRTTHAYITEIFRKFNVSGRAGLTALWLGHQPAGPSR